MSCCRVYGIRKGEQNQDKTAFEDQKEEDSMKVVIKHPEDAYGHLWHISAGDVGGMLHELQRIVGGYIETLTIATTPPLVIVCDEEGRLKGKAHCLSVGGQYPVDFVGTIIVCGFDGEDLTDFPMHFENWMELVNKWRASDGGNDD